MNPVCEHSARTHPCVCSADTQKSLWKIIQIYKTAIATESKYPIKAQFKWLHLTTLCSVSLFSWTHPWEFWTEPWGFYYILIVDFIISSETTAHINTLEFSLFYMSDVFQLSGIAFSSVLFSFIIFFSFW